jgi:DNA-binding GntR family transcriptional regulator
MNNAMRAELGHEMRNSNAMSAGEPASGPGARAVRRPVVRPAPLRHAVFDALLELIISRELRPGEHLGEGELADQLGVSRQPVREAFQQLHAEGWVDLRPGQGAFVHSPTDKEVDDLLAVRTMLESESARLAALARTDADIGRLWQLWDAGTRAVEGGDPEAMVDANANFHACVMGVGDNSVLAELGRLVDRRVRWHYRPIAQARGKNSWDEHAELIRAIAAGDADRAAQIMSEHTERTRQVTHEAPEPESR